MKRTIKLGVMGLLLAAGVVQSNAQSNWVQAANVSISAVTPAGKFTLTSAEIVVALGGLVGTNGLTTTTSLSTNTAISAVASTDTNFSQDATLALSTNSYWFTTNLVSGTNLVYTNFPASIVASNVVVTVVSNSVSVSATNNVTLTETTNNPPTYTFVNELTVAGTNGYVFTNTFVANSTTSPAPYITAVLQSGSTPTNLIFSLEYSTLVTNVVTNTVSVGNVVTNPAFTKANKLVLYSPLAGSTNLPKFGVLTGTSKAPVLNDISGFLYLTTPAGAPSFALKGVNYALDDLVLAGGSTGSFTAEAEVYYTLGSAKVKGAGTFTVTKSSTAILTGFGSLNLGDLGVNAVIFTGKVTTSGGSAL